MAVRKANNKNGKLWNYLNTSQKSIRDFSEKYKISTIGFRYSIAIAAHAAYLRIEMD